MATTAMGQDTAGEASSHMVVPNAPNMCITPAAPSPLPMPYPLTGSTSKLATGTEKSEVEGKKVLTPDGAVDAVHGNEAGTQKDIVTFTTGGKAFVLPVPAVTIHFEGQPVGITGTPGFANTQ